MNKVDKDAINQRFSEAYERLKKAGLFKVQNDLAAALSWNQTTLSTVLKGGRPLPLDKALTFCNKYNISQDWLLHGNGKMFSGDEPTSPAPVTRNTSELEKRNQELQSENSELKNKIISLHEEIKGGRKQFEKQIERRIDKVLAAVLSEKKN